MDEESETRPHAFVSAVVTLTLGILGSSVLPVPWAFSRVGVAAGLGFSLAVALANAYTGTLLLRAARHLHKSTYEGVVEAALGSRMWRILAEVALICLLFGTLAGDAALLADAGAIAVRALFRGEAPAWLAGSGRVPMLALVAVLVLPLSLMRRMRQLERAATAGVGLVLLLAGVMVYQALAAGMPALASGELPLWRVASVGELPEAIAILGFAFYTQPMLLPLLSEMPPGREGVDIMVRALQVVTAGVALAVYSVVGVFGAARWGLATEGDVLVNRWLPGRAAGGLDAAMAAYLSISMAPMVITMRYLLDSVTAAGELRPYQWQRDATFTVCGIAAATGVALACPTQAERLFAITGASAVCLVSYVLPAAVHLRLYLRGYRVGRWWQGAGASDTTAWLLEDAARLESAGVGRRESGVLASGMSGGLDDGQQLQPRCEEGPPEACPYPSWREAVRVAGWRGAWRGARHVALPVLVAAAGAGFSAVALAQSIAKM